MAQHGGKRDGAGRKPGVLGQAKRALSELAKAHAPAALQSLAEIAQNGKSEAARVSAATAILDRAYGKPSQALKHGGLEGGPVQVIIQGADAEL